MGNDNAKPREKKEEKDQKAQPAPPPAPINYGIEWSQTGIIGMHNVKRALDASYSLPLRFPRFCQGSKPCKTLLLWGPPGTGKTMLAQGYAKGTGLLWKEFQPGEIVSKWYGDSEKIVKQYFSEALDHGRTLLFIDEIDAFLTSRTSDDPQHVRTLKTQFLISFQEFLNAEEKKPTRNCLIAATNTINDLDPAVRRRFQQLIFCPLPDASDRKLLLESLVPANERAASLTPAAFQDIANQMHLYSGSDINRLVTTVRKEPVLELQRALWFRPNTEGKWAPCQESDEKAVRKNLHELENDSLAPRRQLVPEDFIAGLSILKPNLNQDEYDEFLLEAGRHGGNVAQQAQGADQRTHHERTEEQRELDFISFGIPMDRATLPCAFPDPGSANEFGQLTAAMPRFARMVEAHNSQASRVLAQWQAVVFCFVVGSLFLAPVYWLLISALGLLTVLSVLVLPLVSAFTQWDHETNIAKEVQQFAVIFLLSVVASTSKKFVITDYWFVDSFVAMWISYLLVKELSIIISFFLLSHRPKVLQRRTEVQAVIQSRIDAGQRDPDHVPSQQFPSGIPADLRRRLRGGHF